MDFRPKDLEVFCLCMFVGAPLYALFLQPSSLNNMVTNAWSTVAFSTLIIRPAVGTEGLDEKYVSEIFLWFYSHSIPIFIRAEGSQDCFLTH